MYFHYAQSNSGGEFHGPAHHVIVEAATPEEADRIAQKHGVYFDGVDSGTDCACCGDRWSTAYGDGHPEPTIYGKVVSEETPPEDDWARRCAKRAGKHILIVRRAN